ncbi:MAG: GNAT family N-acetyltransferase [Anaerolineae bacterium]|nr:GNAT family N-acetyltransferase [Anaerolineae bacterium]
MNVSTEFLSTRAPTPGDAEAVAGLLNLCAVAERGTWLMTVEQVRVAWTSSGFQPATDAWLLATPAGAVVGYVELWQRGDTAYSRACVHPEYVGRGLGTALVHWAEDRARQSRLIRTLRVGVAAGNAAARRLLHREGYSPAGRFWLAEGAFGRVSCLPEWLDSLDSLAIRPGLDDDRLGVRFDVFEKVLQSGLRGRAARQAQWSAGW